MNNTRNLVCHEIEIATDDALEETEKFIVTISSLDSSIYIPSPNISILIQDSTGKSFGSLQVGRLVLNSSFNLQTQIIFQF